MTPADFRAIHDRLGLSASELAVILGVAATSVRRWRAEGVSYARGVNPTVARVMVWMDQGWRPPEWPDRKISQLENEERP